MIDRLNFFDVYGYLVPGSVFVLVVCLPYALLDPKLFSIDLGSGLVAVMVAYVIGFHLYSLAELTLVSKVSFEGQPQHYSAFILDDRDPHNTFGSKEFRRKLREAIGGYFRTPGEEARYFLPARAVLLHKKLAAYVEQYQGMYVMSRGISLASALGACYLAGWSIVALPPGWRVPRTVAGIGAAIFIVVAILGAAVLSWVKWDPGPVPRRLGTLFRLGGAEDRLALESRAAWLVVICVAGFLISVAVWRAQPVAGAHVAAAVSVALSVCVLMALRSYAAFRHFALLFARTVYNDFYVMVREAERNPKSAGAGD